MKPDTEKIITDFIKANPRTSSRQIYSRVERHISFATLKRVLQKLVNENGIIVTGKGKSTGYELSPGYGLLFNVNVENYFEKEIDQRDIKQTYNFSLIKETLALTPVFTKTELETLMHLQSMYEKNIEKLTPSEYQKEQERLAIDLSWKSSQIEGNTYSLLETERLLKEQSTAAGKTKDEATMLLNHKAAIDFIIVHPDNIKPLTVRIIEDIHSLLIKELDVDRNIRKRRVGISGTNYKPLDNEHQIKEALEDMCLLINAQNHVFTQALMALALLSYIQPFMDGNKRTARIISNAILMNQGYCPLSYRTTDALEYKKAMLIFYEQNNISAIKRIFIEQFEFAVKTYF